MMKKLILTLVALIVIFVGVIAMQPSNFRVSRSATIDAKPAEIFVQVNDLHQWNAWSPWAKLDPAAKLSFEGPNAGKGAIMRWAGNHEVGEGSMTIIESVADKKVRFQLDFLKPFAATHRASFIFKEKDGKTQVRWSMYGKNNFLGKAMGLIFNCEKTVGEQFDTGLKQLKQLVEKKEIAK